MNVLHIHISDTSAFPMELVTQPNITYYGAYDEDSVYTLVELRGMYRLCVCVYDCVCIYSVIYLQLTQYLHYN